MTFCVGNICAKVDAYNVFNTKCSSDQKNQLKYSCNTEIQETNAIISKRLKKLLFHNISQLYGRKCLAFIVVKKNFCFVWQIMCQHILQRPKDTFFIFRLVLHVTFYVPKDILLKLYGIDRSSVIAFSSSMLFLVS